MADGDSARDPETVDQEIAHLLVLLQQRMEGPTKATLLADLGRRFNRLGDFAQGRAALEEAHKLAPDNPNVVRSLALAQFGDGQWREALGRFDAVRWGLERYAKYFRAFPHPPWQGEAPEGKRLLLWAEQGIGDQVMQARVLAPLIAAGAEITVEADPRMAPLITRTWPQVICETQTVDLPEALVKGAFDHQASMFSAWRWADLEVPQPAYLVPDHGLVEGFHRAWAQQEWATNVGISWRSQAAATGGPRSLPEAMLRPLVQRPSVTFHSLQYGADAEEVAALSKRLGRPIYMDRDSDPLKNIDRQAAQIAALDLVISIDNATVHVAGAVGTETWALLPAGSDWRWGAEGTCTTLYDSLRLYRSTRPGVWAPTIAEVIRDFAAWAEKR